MIDEVILINHSIEGKNVEIRRAIPKEEMTEEPKKQKLFVGGLPKHITSGKNIFILLNSLFLNK